MDQLNIFDTLAALNPRVVVEMEAEPGWVWACCPTCREVRYLRRKDIGSRCILTPACPGRLEGHLECLCVVCGKPVTRRRVGKNVDFCSVKCEEGGE